MISAEAQAVIDRLASHTWRRELIDRGAVEMALAEHMLALGLPPLPCRWFATARDGYAHVIGAARSAAWSAAASAAASAARSASESAAWSAAASAAWSAARSAARSAAASAARSAAHKNGLAAFDHPTTARLVAIWSPMESAFAHGLWLYWVMEAEIVCVEQPSLWIDGDRLHRADGPAVEWPDGEAYYFWRGTQVPADWITDKGTLTAKTALTWRNIEQRRAACEIIGWHRILAELPSRVINKHKDPQIGELIEVDLPDSGKERFLRVLCGTGREFAIPVPRTCRTALSAQAWTYGMSAKEFAIPEVRT